MSTPGRTGPSVRPTPTVGQGALPRQPGTPPAIAPASGLALWNLGFRPFYLLASIFAATAVPLWIAQYAGLLGGSSYLAGPMWHAHEMVFGFAVAVIAGFLLTAVQNWTGQPTPAGAKLAGLAIFWVVARAAAFTPHGFTAGLLSVAFPLLVAVAIAIPIVRSANRRNYMFIAALVMLALTDLCFQLAYQGFVDAQALGTTRVALDLVLFVMTVISGRVVPMFTNNAILDAGARRNPVVEGAAVGGVLALLVADLLQAPAVVVGSVAVATAVAHAARLWLWRPWKTVGAPMVWILHVACLWIVVHLLLRAPAAAGWIAEPLATHALTLGGIGSLTLGMMTRTARGHTGRPVSADRFELAMFLLMQMAAMTRVFAPLLVPAAYMQGVGGAAVLWSAAFGLYAIRYWPVLTRARLDRKPG